MNVILAIESSCDETSAAVLIDGIVKSNVISSQIVHTQFGGVIPELASRAHVEVISSVVREALLQAQVTLKDVTAIGVTTQPGLAGSLIVGSSFAKGLALKLAIPCVPVNHIEGHLFSGYLEEPSFGFPSVALVVSGGHTSLFYVRSFQEYEILGSTRDDAAGEAFDKTAKLIGLPYPGGPLIDKFAKQGNPAAINFPRPLMYSKKSEFSFSGMKTSVRTFVHENYPSGVPSDALPDICASIQEAIVDVLIHKTMEVVKQTKAQFVSVSGGVSANSRLRFRLQEEISRLPKKWNTVCSIPRMSYSIDNAAMIGFIAYKKLLTAESKEDYRDLNFRVNSSALRLHKHGSAIIRQ